MNLRELPPSHCPLAGRVVGRGCLPSRKTRGAHLGFTSTPTLLSTPAAALRHPNRPAQPLPASRGSNARPAARSPQGTNTRFRASFPRACLSKQVPGWPGPTAARAHPPTSLPQFPHQCLRWPAPPTFPDMTTWCWASLGEISAPCMGMLTRAAAGTSLLQSPGRHAVTAPTPAAGVLHAQGAKDPLVCSHHPCTSSHDLSPPQSTRHPKSRGWPRLWASLGRPWQAAAIFSLILGEPPPWESSL